MENKEDMSYVINMLKEGKETTAHILDTLAEVKETTVTLSKNQDKLFKQYESLSKKVDDNYTKLDKKIDDNYSKLDKKIFANYQAIDKNYSAIIGLQKEVKDLRTDVDIVYDLEQDSRKKIQNIQ